MLKCRDIINEMEKIAPKNTAEEWDNPGLAVGSPEQAVDKLLVCLDVSEQVIERAIKENAQLIVTHHPFIFRPIKNIRTDRALGSMIEKVIKHDIAVFAAHTNLDKAEGGVNDVLAQKLGLVDWERLPPDLHGVSYGRIGHLAAEISFDEFAANVKAALPTKYIRIVRAGERKVRKVALCGGSSAEFIATASFYGADVYVGGDIRYHDAQHAVEMGIHVIDGGHFGTEYPVVAALAEKLRAAFADKGAQILIDDFSTDFFTVI